MTFSPLASSSVSTHKKSSRQGNPIEQFIIHHTAGGSDAFAVEYLANAARKVSATYVLQTTGNLVGIVPEEYRPWTTGWDADKTAITVETVNTTTHPTWEVSAAQITMLSRMAADFCIRYGWGSLSRANVRGHREFHATACPGPYIWPRMDAIIAEANRIVAEDTGTVPPPPPAGPSLADVDRIVNEIIRGEWGNGAQRVLALKQAGFTYSDIEAIQGEVDRRMAEINKTPPPTLKPVSVIATEVIRGDWGNGKDRVAALTAAGYDATAVQAEVNRQLDK